MRRRDAIACLLVGCICGVCASGRGDAPPADDPIWARVGMRTIRRSDVEQALRRATITGPLDPAQRRAAEHVALGELVDRAVVADALDRRNFLPGEADWSARWKQFVEPRLSDERLEAYFQAHRRDFDGTQLRVSHLFWRF